MDSRSLVATAGSGTGKESKRAEREGKQVDAEGKLPGDGFESAAGEGIQHQTERVRPLGTVAIDERAGERAREHDEQSVGRDDQPRERPRDAESGPNPLTIGPRIAPAITVSVPEAAITHSAVAGERDSNEFSLRRSESASPEGSATTLRPRS